MIYKHIHKNIHAYTHVNVIIAADVIKSIINKIYPPAHLTTNTKHTQTHIRASTHTQHSHSACTTLRSRKYFFLSYASFSCSLCASANRIYVVLNKLNMTWSVACSSLTNHSALDLASSIRTLRQVWNACTFVCAVMEPVLRLKNSVWAC